MKRCFSQLEGKKISIFLRMILKAKIHFYSLFLHKHLSQYFMKIRNSIAYAKIGDCTCKKIIFSPDVEKMVKLSQKGLIFIEGLFFYNFWYIYIYRKLYILHLDETWEFDNWFYWISRFLVVCNFFVWIILLKCDIFQVRLNYGSVFILFFEKYHILGYMLNVLISSKKY